jgi:hypothetical protein
MTGYGRAIYKNGDHYLGFFLKNKRKGRGVMNIEKKGII